ncbi:threonine--tRNA ligase [Candidatus Woesebacteria bacterium RIFCSPHIGHO2_01_FULL_38_10]|uniref:Threonine--tRNA ligase n=1 Tax=Candidatus Woesebacteria bacterium RIFCSPLOWO2_01_FULL_39_10b TaxID=1802517 RepID=A0A1F8BAK5_9BACT|nr:MAG: threonine--tRNA ligase [Candidatus Woesebacteria bacterium RIFCSPHIGHO2_01_FULL_38_10]OGM60425.1 MAG: threonine--tRNA ligase [Candidatus Woesebacteria bacterium RIFCSPLOWO2_01_FULL_39_10b]
MRNKKVKPVKKNEGLWTMRHSTEHVLTQAMLKLFPGLKMAMGPATDEGFYFDFDPSTNSGHVYKISEEDFPKIESEMQRIIKANLPIKRKVIPIKNARALFKGNEYKQEWLDEIENKGEKLTVFWTGKEFVDLCVGPHVASTGKIGPLKLLSIAGAYWRGSEKNKMLVRIYGTAFPSKKELDEYLQIQKEAKNRDHRKLGRDLDLFTFAEEVGPGLPLWTPKGTIIQQELRNWAEETEKKWGYVRVRTPHIAKHTLYEISGHLPYYKDNMYSPMDIDGEDYYLKGMNCPHHHMIYKSSPKSYRDLPLRYAEYGEVYRYEQSGTLFGLMRVRFIQQNDAHIYCAMEDAEKEFLDVLKLHEYYYNIIGLTRDDYHIVMGLPDEKKRDKYHGDKSLWDKAEDMMRQAIKKSGIKWVDDIGGAAFYGPKIDFNITSSVGRVFGISTNQLDLYMPERFNLTYTDKDGSEKLTAVIHRAPLGSHERFIGFLIEHFGGAFPVWLTPVQVKVLPVTEKTLEYAREITKRLDNEGIRVELNDRNETLQAKIRDAQLEKIPYMLIIGNKEQKAKNITVRLRSKKDLGWMSLGKFVERVKDKIEKKSLIL